MKKELLLFAGSLMFAAGTLSAQTFLSEDFEGGSMPAGWSSSPAGAWTVPGISSTYFAPPAHTTYASCNDDQSQTAANGNSILESSVVNLTGQGTVFLKYDAFFQGASYNSVTEAADVVYSTDGGSTWTSFGQVTADNTGWDTYAVDMSSQIGNQANVKVGFRYNDGGQWEYGFAVDNVSLFVPSPISAALTTITPATGSPQSFGAVNSSINLGGVITNNGTSPITAITVKYNAGAGVQTYNINSINVPAFGTYSFTHSVPYMIPSTGPHPVTMWIELTGDNNHSDDTAMTTIQGAAFIPVHAVTFEEATGTWCGWCVRGIVFMDSIKDMHGNSVNVVAVHNSDPMTVTAYDAGVGTLIAGYPSTLVNRDLVSDPSNAFPDYDNSINDFGYADIYPTVSYNSSTRVVNVSVNAAFAVALNGDYRFMCAYIENGVHDASGGTWDQHNYYSYQSQNLPLYGQGVDYQALPQVIPSAQMYYRFVARNMEGGFTGQAGSLPASIPANSVQSYSFPSWTIPAGYNVDSMQVIVMLIDNNTSPGHIMNSAGRPIWDGPAAVTAPVATNSLSVYPNPFDQSATISLNMADAANVTVDVYSMTGELVSSENKGNMTAGEHQIPLNGSNLSDGMYFVTVHAGASTVTTKVTVAH